MRNLKTSAVIRPPITEHDFCSWLGQAETKDVLIYHRGLLAFDVNCCSGRLQEPERKQLCEVARRAWWAAQRGWVHLVQRRNGLDDFFYLAIARPRPKTIAASLSPLFPMEAA